MKTHNFFTADMLKRAQAVSERFRLRLASLASISNRSELHCPDSKSEQCPPDLDGCKGLISNEALNAPKGSDFKSDL